MEADEERPAERFALLLEQEFLLSRLDVARLVGALERHASARVRLEDTRVADRERTRQAYNNCAHRVALLLGEMFYDALTDAEKAASAPLSGRIDRPADVPPGAVGAELAELADRCDASARLAASEPLIACTMCGRTLAIRGAGGLCGACWSTPEAGDRGLR